MYLSCAVGLRLETPWIAQRSSHADQQSSHSQSLAALAKPRATHHILVLGGATSCSHVLLTALIKQHLVSVEVVVWILF